MTLNPSSPADGAMTRNDTLANVNATLAAVRRYFPSTPLVVTLGNNDVRCFATALHSIVAPRFCGLYLLLHSEIEI